MKKISIFSFCFFILLSGLYIWGNKLHKNYAILKNNKTEGISNNKKNKTVETSKQITKSINTNNGIAYAEVVKNKETGTEEFKIHLPPGKRLYNEEKMNEVATSANLEGMLGE